MQGVSYEEQKEVKKTFVKMVKAIDKLKEMEAEYLTVTNEYRLVKMLRFVEAKGLDIMAFINKYGKQVDENNYATWYSIGHVIKVIDK